MTASNDVYAEALAEIEEGRLDKGAWARAYAESGGDESKAKAAYIKARAESTIAAQAWPDTQPPVENTPKHHAKPVSTPGLQPSEQYDFYRAAIGEKNLDYYLNKFRAFDEKGPGLHASWNWAAFLFTGFWALYRKMYGWFFAWWAVATLGTIFSRVPESQISQGLSVLVLFLWVGFSVFANSLYLRRIEARITAEQRSNSDVSQVGARLNADNGVHTWVAYFFGAVPALGIVMAIALPVFQDHSKRQVLAVNLEQVPTPNSTSGALGANDQLVAPVSQVEWDKGVITPPTASSQISDFLESKPNSGPSVLGQQSIATTAPSPQDSSNASGVQYSPPPPSKAATAVVKNYELQEQAKSSKENSDLNEAAERAVRDFPYLDTPEGAKVLEKIVARRNELIQEGTYPALALTRAVNQYAAANAPQASAKGGTDSVPVKTRQNQNTDASGCRWVTPQQWSCK